MYVPLRKALEDFLRQHDLTIDDVLDAMDDSKEGAYEALRKRVNVSEKDLDFLCRSLSSRELNLLLLAIQIFLSLIHI